MRTRELVATSLAGWFGAVALGLGGFGIGRWYTANFMDYPEAGYSQLVPILFGMWLGAVAGVAIGTGLGLWGLGRPGAWETAGLTAVTALGVVLAVLILVYAINVPFGTVLAPLAVIPSPALGRLWWLRRRGADAKQQISP